MTTSKHINFKHACIFLCISSGIISCQTSNKSDNHSRTKEVHTIMKGLPNQKGQEKNTYLTAGDKTYIIGTQDGNFPDLGSHVTGEMGGIWNHLIKLLDGFWVQISDTTGKTIWLANAHTYISYPFGSEFIYDPIYDGVSVRRFQFTPQGMNGAVITYTLENLSNQDQELTFGFIAKTDLSPVWSSEQIGLQDQRDTIIWDTQESVFKARDLGNSWNVVWGTTEKPTKYDFDTPTYIQTSGLGRSASSSYKLILPKGKKQEISFVVSGSKNSMNEALTSYKKITQHKTELLGQKKTYYTQVIERGLINIPDKKLEEVYNWCKINTEWLIADMENVGRFLGAGAIEYPWLFGCDNSYALQGVVASGNHLLAEETLRAIKNMSKEANANGRILHEMAFNAFVSNKGNTQETAHFITTVWNVFNWTGNKVFLSDMYPYMKKGIDFLLKEMDTNKNLFPEGYGIMEVRGLNAELIDVAVYTQQALEAMSKIVVIMGEQFLSAIYASQASTLKEKINNLFWDQEAGTYCDFYGTKEQALKTTKGTIAQILQDKSSDNSSQNVHIEIYKNMYKQFEKQPAGIKKGWLTNKNWVISTPIETHIAPKDRAIQQLDKVRKEHCGEYGPYLSAIERDRMMTIATGVQAMAECAYGRVDEALWYINCIVDTFGRTLPGSINEMMPDYGCPVQAWTIYGIATPLIRYIYGLQPETYKKTLTLSPNLPSDWNFIEIKDLPIGDNKINYKVKRLDDGLEITLETTEKDWNYLLQPVKQPIKRFSVNGKEQQI